jgi:hypothetical protein
MRFVRTHRVNNRFHRACAEIGCEGNTPSPHWESFVADLLFVVLTVALFAALTVLVKAAERG